MTPYTFKFPILIIVFLTLLTVSASADNIPFYGTASIGNGGGADLVTGIGPSFNFLGGPVEGQMNPLVLCQPGTLCNLTVGTKTSGRFVEDAYYNGMQAEQLFGTVTFTSQMLLPSTKLSAGPFTVPVLVSGDVIAYQCPFLLHQGECTDTLELFAFSINGTGFLNGNVLGTNLQNGMDAFGNFTYSFAGDATITYVATPEPPTWSLLGVGLSALLATALCKGKLDSCR
jgi:hypothetical protein